VGLYGKKLKLPENRAIMKKMVSVVKKTAGRKGQELKNDTRKKVRRGVAGFVDY